MLQTPLATLIRLRRPSLSAVAEDLGVRIQRLSAVCAGRDEAGEEFLAKVAKALAIPLQQVRIAYLQGRKAYHAAQVRETERKIADARAEQPQRRKSA